MAEQPSAAMPPPQDPTAPSEHTQPPPPAAAKEKGEKKDQKKDDDLSEEDLALKDKLELYVLRAQDADPGVQKLALESMRQVILSATSSMTSVPMPLKFFLLHYRTELSEEDLALKEKLELYVLQAQDTDPGVQKLALESMRSMRQEIRSATSSMTSVPKPLKFLLPHYGTLKFYFNTMSESELKKDMADILSVLALTMSIEGDRESLSFCPHGFSGQAAGQIASTNSDSSSRLVATMEVAANLNMEIDVVLDETAKIRDELAQARARIAELEQQLGQRALSAPEFMAKSRPRKRRATDLLAPAPS